MVSVLLADDSGIMRKAISRVLQDDPDIHLVAEAASFSEAIELTSKLRPQIVIFDLHMDDEDTLTPSQVKSCLVGSLLLAISVWNDNESKALADSFGAVTLLDKMKLADELIPAIKHYGKSQDQFS